MNIECSPEKAWPFLGLPDVAPMQEYRDRMVELDPESWMKNWSSATGGVLEEVRKTVCSQFAGTPPKD